MYFQKSGPLRPESTIPMSAFDNPFQVCKLMSLPYGIPYVTPAGVSYSGWVHVVVAAPLRVTAPVADRIVRAAPITVANPVIVHFPRHRPAPRTGTRPCGAFTIPTNTGFPHGLERAFEIPISARRSHWSLPDSGVSFAPPATRRQHPLHNPHQLLSLATCGHTGGICTSQSLTPPLSRQTRPLPHRILDRSPE